MARRRTAFSAAASPATVSAVSIPARHALASRKRTPVKTACPTEGACAVVQAGLLARRHPFLPPSRTSIVRNLHAVARLTGSSGLQQRGLRRTVRGGHPRSHRLPVSAGSAVAEPAPESGLHSRPGNVRRQAFAIFVRPRSPNATLPIQRTQCDRLQPPRHLQTGRILPCSVRCPHHGRASFFPFPCIRWGRLR